MYKVVFYIPAAVSSQLFVQHWNNWSEIPCSDFFLNQGLTIEGSQMNAMCKEHQLLKLHVRKPSTFISREI